MCHCRLAFLVLLSLSLFDCMGRIINQAVMGFWDSAKKKAQQAKLQGQILLLERQMTALQHQLGVDIFSLVFGFAHAQASPGADSAHHDNLMESVQGLSVIFMAAFEDVSDLVDKRAAADEGRDRIEANQEAERNAERSTAAAASSWMGAAASKAKLSAEIAYYDREILVRKQIFGLQVAEELNLVNASLTELPDNELTKLLQKYQADAKALLRTKKEHADEIARLGGNLPTENQSLVIPPDESSDGQFVQQDHSTNSDSMTEEYL